ncbi:MAG: resolvase [Bradyrhizobium sp.]|nr:resolvase [Bradyrhizobium sp.]
MRRVFRDYAAGRSAKKIARDLNHENIPGLSGGAWGFSTILGNPKRGTGLLNNELYVGRIVWNRLRYLKDPVTGKRQSRLNDSAEWIIQEVPDISIVDEALWQRAKQRQEVTKHVMASAGDGSEPAFRDFKRPKYLLERPDALWVLRRWLFCNLDLSPQVFDRPEQGHLRQSHEHPARRVGEARSGCAPQSSDGARDVRSVLPKRTRWRSICCVWKPVQRPRRPRPKWPASITTSTCW